MIISLLKQEEIWGDNSLEIFRLYGRRTAVTDLAVTLGALMVSDIKSSEGDLTGYAWTSSCHKNKYAVAVAFDGEFSYNYPYVRRLAVRPVIRAKDMPILGQSRIQLHNKRLLNVYQYGTFPQDLADPEIGPVLTYFFKKDQLRLTGRSFTFDGVMLNSSNLSFEPLTYPEYVLDGKKYIRVVAQKADAESTLSNGETLKENKLYWLEVKPIQWLYDEKAQIYISKKALFAGIVFDDSLTYNGDFSKTFLNHYLNTYFAKEILNFK